MIIVGELINASRKTIKAAIEAKDERAIKKVTQDQFDVGSNYIDFIAGVFADQEPEYLKWLGTEQKEKVLPLIGQLEQ